MLTIFRKELADYFTSIRVLILFLLVFLASAGGLFAAQQGIRGTGTETGFVFLKLFTTSGEAIPSLITFTALFIPIIGIALGFDAINSERSSGTLSRILSQPIYRDNVINAKFLAGISTLSIMVIVTILLVSGFGLGARLIASPLAPALGLQLPMAVPFPNAEEIIRLFLYLVLTIIYGAFWMGLAILFSVLFRRIATSLLSSLALWLFFGFFYIQLIVPAIANTIETGLMLLRLSPNTLFQEATTVLLFPQWRGAGILTAGEEVRYMLANPLSLGQSMLLIWPHITSLVGLTAVCFAISYILFMKQEIRAT